jgi:hypothetical protein
VTHEDRHLVFDDEVVNRASVDFDWPVEPEDEGVVVGGAYELRAAMLGVFGGLLHGIDRVRPGQRVRAVGMRTLALVSILNPSLILPGASLVEIAGRFGVSQASLSHSMSRSSANLQGIRKRYRMRLRRVRLTRY